MSTDETNPHDWLFLARERLAAADALHASLGTTLSGVELLQESVERYLKGYLIGKGWHLQKIHNLATLLDHALEYDEQFSDFADLCETLTAQFWAQHYPGDDLTDVGKDYSELRRAAEALIVIIEQSLRKS